MSILTWIEDKKRLKVLNAPKYFAGSTDSSKGLWTRCDKCGVILYIKHLKENQRVCFSCSYHLQMMSGERIENLLDRVSAPTSRKQNEALFAKTKETQISTWRPLDETVSPCDPLKFHDQKAYTDRLQDAQERTGLQDAIQTGTGMIDGIPVALAVMDFSFMGGSMGSVVGEKITRLIEYATGEGLTLLIVSASGGARMQEGVFSLMQMAKISSALQIYQSCAKLLYISILTSPTTGGVTASFAMLGDIIFAEPKALIAFAGRRVIEQTLCEDLPEDFQTSEYMLHHGLVDLIVPRRFLRQALSESIRLYQNAPFKKRGEIPFGVQNPISFLTEEKIRRSWGKLTYPGTKILSSASSKSPSSPGAKAQSLTSSSAWRTKMSKENVESFAERGLSEFYPHEKGVRYAEQNLQKEKSAYKSSYVPYVRSKVQGSGLSKIGTCKGSSRIFRAAQSSRGTEIDSKINRVGSTDKQSSTLRSKPRAVYREILTSFEIMLNLFGSGNSKKESRVPLRLQRSADNQSRKDFLSSKSILPFWIYNGMILQEQNRTAYKNQLASILFNKELSSNYFIVDRYRKDQPLYQVFKKGFAGLSPKDLSQVFAEARRQNEKERDGDWSGTRRKSHKKKVTLHPESSALSGLKFYPKVSKDGNRDRLQIRYQSQISPTLSVSRNGQSMARAKSRLNVPKNLSSKAHKRFGFANGFSTPKNENGNIPIAELLKKSENDEVFLSKTKSGRECSFSTWISIAFANKCFFTPSKNICKALVYKGFLTSIKFANLFKPLENKLLTPRSFSRSDFAELEPAFPLRKYGFKKQSVSYIVPRRLKQSFVREVSSDFGFFYTPVPRSLSDTYMIKPVKNWFNEERMVFTSALDGLDTREQISPPALLYNLRSLSEKMVESHPPYGIHKSTSSQPSLSLPQRGKAGNGTQSKVSYLSNEPSKIGTSETTKPLQLSGQVSPSERGLIDSSNAIETSNRSAIGIKHTDYLRQRSISFLQNKNRAENGLYKKQNGTTTKSDSKLSVTANASFGTARKRSSVFFVPGSKFCNPNQDLSLGAKMIDLRSQTMKGKKSSQTSKNLSLTSYTTGETDIDFLNQAIELAATESIEWRAFYIYQQVSENMGFLQDFLQQDLESRKNYSNMLFYKSLCRTEKALCE